MHSPPPTPTPWGLLVRAPSLVGEWRLRRKNGGSRAHMDVGVGCSLHKEATQGAGGAAARPALGFSGCGPWRGRHSTHAVVPFPNPVKGATGERCGLRAPEAAVQDPGPYMVFLLNCIFIDFFLESSSTNFVMCINTQAHHCKPDTK